ncbi:Rv3654c family TadE-like protein [Micromonospora rosaria]|uniref:Rv3654c family TadE-like protein n=1 Tax=Micromonospora rosaria TaxID=47874 RepID=UPI000A023906|nr:Rv3654c family TadE-like protein [Micromonospora rosaria]
MTGAPGPAPTGPVTALACCGERGGASVCLLAVGLVFVLFGTFGAAVGAAGVARQRAGVAADFGALAGAGAVAQGPSDACRWAESVAAANGGRLTACRVDGLDVQVTVQVGVSPLPGLTRIAVVTARAGPVRS